jgi:hypothetical protein
MKPFVLLLGASLLLSGCATSISSQLKRIEKRKQERSAAYAALSPDQKAAVDAGHIKIGMNMDAVHIAWGKPTQIITGETPQGATVTWLYQDTYLQSYSYWGYSPFYHPGYGRYRDYYSGPQLVHDFQPVPYVRGEVNFEGGLVKQWRTLPSPGY